MKTKECASKIYEIVRRHGFSRSELTGKSKTRDLSNMRQALCLFLRGKGYSFPRIGGFLNRDHSSIVHACKRSVDDNPYIGLFDEADASAELVEREIVITPRKRWQHIYDERGAKCQICLYDEIVEVHHIDRDRSNNNKENLIVLCPNCHKKVYAGIMFINRLPSGGFAKMDT